MKLFSFLIGRNHRVGAFALLFSLVSLGHILATPTIVSFTPPNGATGVPLSTSVVITFSEAMNTSLTMAYLLDPKTYQLLPTSLSWNGGRTVLTCTPTAPLPAGQRIDWNVTGGLPYPMGGSFYTVLPPQLTLTNPTWSGGTFAFDVTSLAGQTLTVEYSTTLRPDDWQTFLTTNSPTGRVHIVDTNSIANPYLFYRARTGW